jgi:Cu(I)/Ag(I) efflux system membrane protein CusA/SilA
MTVCAVLASLIPILWASGIGSDVMKPIAAPMVGVLMKERSLRRGTLQPEPVE